MNRTTLKSRFSLIIPVLLIAVWVGSQQTSANSEPEISLDSSTKSLQLVEYIIVSNQDWSRFRTDVNARLGQGYAPIGGVAINPEGHPVQAMGR